MDITIIVVYLALILTVGLWYGRGIKNLTDYAVAGRSYSGWIIFATLSASFIGGGFSMGNAEKVFRLGIVNIMALWGFSLSMLLVARYLAPRMDNYKDAISVGDIVAKHYGRRAQLFTGIFAALVCAGILGAQVSAIGYIFNIFLGIDHFWGILVGVGVVLVYVVIGGMRSVIATDVVQFILLAVGIPLTLVLGIIYMGGFSAFAASVPTSHLQVPGASLTSTAFLSLFLVFLLGETLVPPYVQRLLLADSSKITARATWWSGLFSILFFVFTGTIGLVALAIKPDLDPNLAMPFLIKEILPIGLRGIMIAAVISIIMSSADSFLNAATVAFVNDVLKPSGLFHLNQTQELRVARYFTLGLGALAIVFAVSIEGILDILIFAYNFWAPVILVPLVFAILGAQTRTLQFFVSGSAGVLTVIVWNYLLMQPAQIDGLVMGVIANLACFLLIGSFSKGKQV